uniref:SLH domain-containing protein n=1 Tax=Strongyloides stercoralis TaxID=6248 RepID=A0A0K0EJR9_STRER
MKVSKMGIISNILCLSVGIYGGIFASQNYEIPNIPSPYQIQESAIGLYQALKEEGFFVRKNEETSKEIEKEK